MKKIKLNETDLMKIVKRVLNEQDEIRFDENDFFRLHTIFTEEFNPPFRRKFRRLDGMTFVDRNGEIIGHIKTIDGLTVFVVPIMMIIVNAVAREFGFKFDRTTIRSIWSEITPHLKSWLEGMLHIEIDRISAP